MLRSTSLRIISMNNNDVKNDLKKVRYNFVDIAKGIAIILVIAGHSSFPYIKGYHMPLFIFLSGLFLSKDRKLGEVIKKRARQLLAIYVAGVFATIVFQIVVDVLKNDFEKILPNMKMWALAGIYGQGTNQDFMIEGFTKIGAYWFLIALFIASVIVTLILDKQYYIIVSLMIAYIAVETCSIVKLPFSIQPAMFSSLFLALGYKAKTEGFLDREPKIILFILSIISYIFAMKYGITISMVNSSVTHGLLSVLVAIAAIYMFTAMSKYLEKIENVVIIKWFIMLLRWMGKNSLIIYFIHALDINVVPWSALKAFLKANGHGDLYNPLRFTSRLLVCVMLCFLITKIPFLYRLFNPNARMKNKGEQK